MKYIAILIMIMLPITMVAEEISKNARNAIEKFQNKKAKADAEVKSAFNTLEKSLKREIAKANKNSNDDLVAEYQGILDSASEMVGDNDLFGSKLIADEMPMRQAQGLAKKIKDGNLTAPVWDKLAGTEVTMKKGILNTEITIEDGASWLIIPHPTDKWAHTYDGKADNELKWLTYNKDDSYQMSYWVRNKGDSNPKLKVATKPIITGQIGNLELYKGSSTAAQKGNMRIKIIKISK